MLRKLQEIGRLIGYKPSEIKDRTVNNQLLEYMKHKTTIQQRLEIVIILRKHLNYEKDDLYPASSFFVFVGL